MRFRFRCYLHSCSGLYHCLMRRIPLPIGTAHTKISNKKYIFIFIFGLLFLIYWGLTCCNEPDYYTCPFEPVKRKKYEKCLDGYLDGSSVGAGLGNILFEFLSFIAIAKKVNRRPIISNKQTIGALEHIREYFPNIGALFDKTVDTSVCNCWDEVVTFSKNCCLIDDSSISKIDSTNDTVRIHTYFTQGIAYLSMLPESLVSNLLEGSAEVVGMAKEVLFPIDPRRHNKKNLCVHTRRGDFINNPLVYESEQIFTREATRFILTIEKNIHDVYAFGNDQDFLEIVFANWTNVAIAAENRKLPPNVEFEFSRLYCDVILLTASASTYGWWLGYLSRGQSVYFNRNFSRPGGLEVQMKKEEFFPAHWKPLELVTAVQIAVFLS